MKVVVVGCGMISGLHLRAVAKYPGATVVGIADRDLERAQAQSRAFDVPHAEYALGDLLSLRPDVVHVLTPPHTHAALAVEALEAGAHVFIEKPMAMTTQECAAIAEAAVRAGRQVCVGHCWLYSPPMIALQALLQSGRAGRVVQAAASFSYELERNPRFGPQHWASSLPGGIAEDLAVHPISMLLRVLGAPRATRGFTLAAGGVPNGKTEDMRAVIDMERGLGSVSVSLRAQPDVALLDVWCTRMLLRLNISSMTITVERNLPMPRKVARAVTNFDLAAQLVANTLSAAWKLARGRVDGSYGIVPLIHAFYSAIDAGVAAPVGVAEGAQAVAVLREIWPVEETGVALRAASGS